MQRLLGFTFVLIVAMMLVATGLDSRYGVSAKHADDAPHGKASETSSDHPQDGHSDSYYDAMELRRDASGQFHMSARVNGADTRFLVDTGADVVALTVDTAQELGIAADPADFRPIMRTASGTGNGMPVMLDTIEIGGHELHGVQAVVMEGLGTNLLGQSVLGKLGKVELRGDTMLIQPD
ncbi:MAG: TIGR02281 family clan AA aspartic protease [Sphingomonadales bacterium]|nr:TIGR02281 family clan AA aspartic protease [Sphingomonadales bacterium]